MTDQKRKPAGRGFAKGGNGFGRTALQREAHYRLEARLLAQGLGVNEIAVKAGLSKAQVSKDIAYLRSVWKARNEADLAFERARQLAEVAHIKQEALEAWERSKQPTKVSRLIQRKGAPNREGVPPVIGTESTLEQIERVGDPRHLEVAMKALDREAALLGLDQAGEADDAAEAMRLIRQGAEAYRTRLALGASQSPREPEAIEAETSEPQPS